MKNTNGATMRFYEAVRNDDDNYPEVQDRILKRHNDKQQQESLVTTVTEQNDNGSIHKLHN